MKSCRLCADRACREVGRQQILGRHAVRYFQCPRCDLLQTETPYWLDEAYREAIAGADVGAMQRTLETATLVEGLSRLLPGGLGRCLDFGGGPGTLTRVLRDRGLDFYWQDKHCANIYARGFEGNLDQFFEGITAFEVWEHLAEVGSSIEAFFERQPRFVLIGTVLHQGYRPDWWYLVPSTGQHIAFFSERTMRHIASRFGYHAIATPAYTLFLREDTQPRISERGLRFLFSHPAWMRRLVGLLGWLRPRLSLTPVDARRLLGSPA